MSERIKFFRRAVGWLSVIVLSLTSCGEAESLQYPTIVFLTATLENNGDLELDPAVPPGHWLSVYYPDGSFTNLSEKTHKDPYALETLDVVMDEINTLTFEMYRVTKVGITDRSKCTFVDGALFQANEDGIRSTDLSSEAASELVFATGLLCEAASMND